MRKKYLLLFMLAFFMLTTLLAACGGNSEEEDASTEEGTTEEATEEDTEGEAEESDSAASDSGESSEGSNLEGTVTLAGSTSVQPLSEELGAAFMEQNPDVRIEVSGGGSGAGVTAAQENTADIGAASRELKEEETGVEPTVIAQDGIAIVVHPDNPVEDMTLDDVASIYAGDITNWSEVGGDDADIVVVSREDGSGTRGAFTDIVLGEETPLTESAVIQNSTGAVAEAVSNDPNAIGYISVGAMNDTVKGLSIDGAEPTNEAISSGDYPVARPFNYVTNEETELSEVAQAYMDFVLSEEGQQVVEESGFIAVE